MRFSVILIPFGLLVAAKYIDPGGEWLYTDDNFVNAHADGVTVDEDDGRFYWFAERKTEEDPMGSGVAVYSSEDLAT